MKAKLQAPSSSETSSSTLQATAPLEWRGFWRRVGSSLELGVWDLELLDYLLPLMNRPPISLRAELRDTVQLAGPIVLNQVGHMSMGIVDTLVAGRIGTTAVAGLGLGVNCFWTFTSVCAGALLALDTYFSQAVGAGDERGLARYLGQSRRDRQA